MQTQRGSPPIPPRAAMNFREFHSSGRVFSLLKPLRVDTPRTIGGITSKSFMAGVTSLFPGSLCGRRSDKDKLGRHREHFKIAETQAIDFKVQADVTEWFHRADDSFFPWGGTGCEFKVLVYGADTNVSGERRVRDSSTLCKRKRSFADARCRFKEAIGHQRRRIPERRAAGHEIVSAAGCFCLTG